MSKNKKQKNMNDNYSKQLKDIIKPVEVVLLTSDTIHESLKKIKEKKQNSRIVYFYVTNEKGQLKGIIPARKLLFGKNDMKVSDVMESAILKLKSEQTLQHAMEHFAKYNLLAFPVVDKDDMLIGIVDVEAYIDDSFNIADARHRADIFQIIGLSLEDGKKVSTFKNYKLRMPWILCSIFDGVLCAVVSRFNENVFSKFLVLAMFVPLVLALSEAISMQSMTQSLQFLRNRQFSIMMFFKKAIKEWKIAVLVALSSSFIVGIVSLFWKEGILPSLTIATGIIVSVIVSACFGFVFPVILHKTGLDPKVAAGPVVLMLSDVFTIFFYFWLASSWLV
jgi:magnesium transporter